MAIAANIFSKCLPAISTTIDRCGTVTLCNAVTAEADTLAGIFTSGSDFRLMSSLLKADITTKMCGARTKGLYDFWMANKRDMSRNIKTERSSSGQLRIEPFIMIDRPSVVNWQFWEVVNGGSTGGNNAQFHVLSRNGMVLVPTWFKTRAKLYINGLTSGGTATRTAWRITSAGASTYGGEPTILVQVASENLASNLEAAKLTLPTRGVAVTGPPNVDDFEKWCENDPGLNPLQSFPSWIATHRRSFCTSELFREFEKLIVQDNPLYAKYQHIPEVQHNKQIAERYMEDRVNGWFWGKKLANQTLSDYRSLEQIAAWSTTDFYTANEGACVGLRAESEGIYEQLYECGFVKDLQGSVLNLEELFIDLRQLVRARKDQGGSSDSWKEIDIFTDNNTARQINRGMILLYNQESAGTFRYNVEMGFVKNGKNPHFGFQFTSYPLPNYPAARFNIVTDDTFDDLLSAANTAQVGNTNRFLWVLDMPGIYPGIVGTNRVVSTTGKQQDLAKVNIDASCVMRTPTREQVLDSVTDTLVVECPANSRIYENFSAAVPEYRGVSGTGPSTDVYGYY